MVIFNLQCLYFFFNRSKLHAQTFTESDTFPNVQSELSLIQLHSISLCCIAGHDREKVSFSSSTSHLEEAGDFVEVTPQPSLTEDEQAK